jgi:hypothetical protein
MTVVYSENRVSPVVEAKMAELQMTLAIARHFVRACELDPERSAEARNDAQHAVSLIDKALDGSIHSFTRNGASR